MKIIKFPTVRYVTSTPNPRKIVAIAARMTYSPRDVATLTEEITEQEIKSSVNAILERRHFSCLRHVIYTFTVSGISRACSHQLVRHTVGHAWEQRSQHYRTEKDPAFIIPETIENLAPGEYKEYMQTAQDMYTMLVDSEIPKEDARMVLPSACETQLIWTANLEAILNFVQTRACRVNTSEILSVAVQVRNLVKVDFPEIAPFLGPTCFTRGVCYEGDKFYKVCRKPWKSPTVLWSHEFPAKIDLVKVGSISANRLHIDESAFLMEKTK